MEESIEACLIGRGESYIREAEQSKDASEAEKKFREALNYLESIEARNENAVSILRRRASDGLIDSMIRQAKEKMGEAEKLFGEGKYYDSKELYRETWEYLSRVEEEAARLKSASHLQKIANLKDVCNRNISKITTAMLDVRPVGDLRLETVDDVVKGKARVDVGEVAAEVTGSPSEKLKEEYGNIEYIGSGGFADVR
ncbi:hypothetical protein [Archaeoglobus sp.]